MNWLTKKLNDQNGTKFKLKDIKMITTSMIESLKKINDWNERIKTSP